ncbi:MAG: hypothetical protein AAF434_17135 [Pseudomonadota bacterium]
MEIKLNDDEIRVFLAGELERQFDFKFTIGPEECWFEVKAGEITDEEVDDIYDVKFCYRAPTVVNR